MVGVGTKAQQRFDFIIEAVEIISYTGEAYDITQMRTHIKIFEDIFNQCISGEMGVIDGMDLPHLLPMIGQEKLRIRFTRPEVTEDANRNSSEPVYESWERTFNVYNITQRKPFAERSQSYMLHFISEEFYKNLSSVVQKGWVKTLNSDIVQEVYDEFIFIDRELNLEPTKHLQNFSAGKMTPFQLFNLMASRSVSKEGNGSGFVFFEDKDKFNFITLGKLFQGEAVQDYIYQPANLPDPNSYDYFGFAADGINDFVNVEAYFHAGNFNPLEKAMHGMYASKLLHVDHLRKRFEEQEFKLDEAFAEFKHISNEKPWTETFPFLQTTSANIKIIASDKDRDLQAHLINRDPDITPSKLEEILQQRTSQLHQIDTFKVVIKVPGDPRRTVGQMINFHLPQNASDVDQSKRLELDDYLQGRYLITSIVHDFELTKYSMSMEIVKDTLHTPIKFVDPAEKYSDIY